MKAYIKVFVVLVFFICSCVPLVSASLSVDIVGDYFIRLPHSSRYVRNTLSNLPDDVIFCIPEIENATSTTAIVDGHSVKLYPGASFRVSKASFIPLTGRFEFSTLETAGKSISIVANNCNAGYFCGHFLLEATPDNGVFFAMKDKGRAWVKDISRNVFELKAGQQVHIPKFGNGVFKNRLDAFWGKAPSSFKHLGEVGQETAYGLVGSNMPSKVESKSEEKTADCIEPISASDDDMLDPEEEAWLNED